MIPTSRGRFPECRECTLKSRALARKIAASEQFWLFTRSKAGSGCGDAADQVFLLEFGLRPNGERIQEVERKRIPQRFVLAVP
jgi:hypothetical protein